MQPALSRVVRTWQWFTVTELLLPQLCEHLGVLVEKLLHNLLAEQGVAEIEPIYQRRVQQLANSGGSVDGRRLDVCTWASSAWACSCNEAPLKMRCWRLHKKVATKVLGSRRTAARVPLARLQVHDRHRLHSKLALLDLSIL
jgi:hypothetical protein